MLLLDAFNKDRASLPQPLQNPPSLAPLPVLPPPDARTQEMINEKLKKAEDLGEQGMVDEAQKALEEAEALKKLGARQEPVLDSSKYTAADVRITDQKLRVCDICGAFLSVYDSRLLGPVLRGKLLQLENVRVFCFMLVDYDCYKIMGPLCTNYLLKPCNEVVCFVANVLFGCCFVSSDRRLADHFGGKLHLGYMQIREKLAELQEERNKSRKVSEDDRRSKERSRDRDRARSRDRERDREERSGSREKERDYDRRSRDRDRHYDRDRGYDRERDRESDRSRNYDSRSRRRSRSRSVERSRDYDRHSRRHDRYDRY
eukprot:TRINITY_DN1686_c0_g1_i12.p1 TRINITY_DN1686_c0_g1~~TRINITY_DN1686_c0_g1_i12.p1  ORF type:complete len:343 (-),score=70.69 TRINITY_DN1686_c0_g1_i12:224-1171(-)